MDSLFYHKLHKNPILVATTALAGNFFPVLYSGSGWEEDQLTIDDAVTATGTLLAVWGMICTTHLTHVNGHHSALLIRPIKIYMNAYT